MWHQPAQTVYVVDDDVAVRESLCELIRARGLHAEPFASAEEFLEQFDSSRPGCLITDLRMSGMSGVQLFERLATEDALPVIVVSGYADVPIAVRLMEQGIVTLLQKPYRSQELLSAVDRALRLDAENRQRLDRQRDVKRRLATLDDEEHQVLALMIGGKPNKVIATRLGVSMRTVDRRRRDVLNKMKTRSVPELAALIAGCQVESNQDQQRNDSER